MSGMMKDFFDRSYYAALDRINGRAYACMVCAGSDGSNAVRQIERIAAGWRLRRVADALIVCTHAQTPQEILRQKRIGPAELERCENMGAALATGLAVGIY
jgi:multimeric flavodoxin WrbA